MPVAASYDIKNSGKFKIAPAGAGIHFFACAKKQNQRNTPQWWPYGFSIFKFNLEALRNSLRSNSPRDYSSK